MTASKDAAPMSWIALVLVQRILCVDAGMVQNVVACGRCCGPLSRYIHTMFEGIDLKPLVVFSTWHVYGVWS